VVKEEKKGGIGESILIFIWPASFSLSMQGIEQRLGYALVGGGFTSRI
jgi:hypothetical protein